jgi:hypothetical protein
MQTETPFSSDLTITPIFIKFHLKQAAMAGYGAISQSDPAHSDSSTKELHCIPKWAVSILEGDDGVSVQRNITTTEHGLIHESSKVTFKVNPESCRFIAYIFFWSMCFFAIAVTKFVVGPALSDGPEVAGNTCPPFDGDMRSTGFDIGTDSHLNEAFGFNNVSKICL